jgi:hypothetical protein
LQPESKTHGPGRALRAIACSIVAAWLCGCGSNDAGHDAKLDAAQKDGSNAETDGAADPDAAPRGLPPARPSHCAELIVSKDRLTPCDVVVCPCGINARVTFQAMSIDGMCTRIIDCDLACSLSPQQVRTCIQQYVTCAADDDCNNGFCARVPGIDMGECTSGMRESSCVDDDDCLADMRCVVDTLEGQRKCEVGLPGDRCNGDQECRPGGHCVLPEDSLLGICSDGAVDSTCLAGADCASGLRCVIRPDFFGTCTAGASGELCYDAADCNAPSRCIKLNGWQNGTCSDGTVNTHCAAHDDCMDGRCTLAATEPRCTQGEVGEPCGVAGDCASGFCLEGVSSAPAPGVPAVPWTCVDGALGSPCRENDDCAEGMCIPGRGCTKGLDGHACLTGDDCSSGRCTSGEVRVCTSGALDAACFAESDCESGHCASRNPTELGYCISGVEGHSCFMDDDCESLRCATGGDTHGLCTTAQPGSPCFVADECESQVCVEDPNTPWPTARTCE